MGIPVLVLGKSGSGKSASLRNFSPDEIGILNVASKPLPFKGGNKYKKINNAGYGTILKALSPPKLKTYVIDDSQYLMAFDSFAKAKVTGYGKFTDMAVNFYNLLQHIIRNTPDDTIVYLLHHVEETPSGGLKAKTIGRMLDEQLTIEGLFSIVLMAVNNEGQYMFVTHSDGTNSIKTPMGMFEEDAIENDLKAVDTAIREYYELNGGNENE